MLKKVSLYLLVFTILFLSLPGKPVLAVIYTVTASVNGGHGTITPLTQKIKPNARAVLTIKPDTGYHLESITDNGLKMPLSSPYAIPIVTEDHQVVVTFAINVYQINSSVSGGHGKVEPTKQTVEHGGKVTLTITPDEGYKITGIIDNGNLIGIKNPLELTNVTVAHNIIVAFTTFTVTSSVIGSHGTVTPLIQTIPSGAKAVVTFKPDVGYQINKIVDNGKEVKVVNPYIIPSVTANRTIQVSFTTAVLAISATVAGGHGSVSVSNTSVLYGGSVRVNITPDQGYHVTGITANGVILPNKEIFVIQNITQDHQIVVSFLEYTISARMIDDHGSITPLKQTVFHGGTATLTITSDPGFKPSYLIDNGSWKSPTTQTSYVIKNVTGDHFVELAYVGITFTITAIVAGGFGKAEPAKQVVKYGSQCITTFIPDRGYQIMGIMDNGKPKLAYSPYKINSVTEDHTIVVNFQNFMVMASVSGGHGTVTPGTQFAGAGGKATVVIIPEAGYRVDKILDNDKVMPLKSPYQLTNILENHSVMVTFAITTYQVSALVVGGHGTVSPATQTVNYGGKTQVLLTPEKGYKIASITDNGISVPIENPYPLYYVTVNRKIEVKYAPIK